MITLAIAGLGYWGPNLLRNFSQLNDCEVRYCSDLKEETLRWAKKQYPDVEITSDYARLLADATLDAIVIATPAVTHHAMAKDALLHHKHVFVEKPLTLNLHQAEELVELAEATNRKLMVGHLMEYHPAIETLKGLIQQGELGDIYYLYSQRVNLGRIRRDENALWSFGPHDLSIMMYLLEQVPETVSTRGHAYLQEGIEDVVFVNLEFPKGIMAQIQLSWIDPNKIRRTTIVGSQKMAVFDDMQPAEMLRIYDKGVTNSPQYGSFAEALSLRFGNVTIPYIKMTEPLKLECQHFLDCIKNNQTPRSDGRDGLRVVKVLQAAQESLDKSGMAVNI